jgi:hypothetical protein
VTAMPANTSGYLNLADQRLDRVRRSLGTARRSAEPERVSADIAVAQVCAMQALAAAIDRLAAATESAPRSAPGDKAAPLGGRCLVAQVSTMQALAAAIDRLAAVTESTARSPDPDRNAYNEQSAAPGYRVEGGLRTDEPAQSEAGPRRCSASTSKGSQCKLPAEPGAAVCAIHVRRMPALVVLPVSSPGVRPRRWGR